MNPPVHLRWPWFVPATLVPPTGPDVPVPGPPGLPTTQRFELAHLAYDEVLDATKHQDDKVGRVLTAVAFLTAGSVALLSQQSNTEYRFQVGSHQVPLVALLAGIFLGCVSLTVLLLLLSVSSRLKLPPGSSRPRGARADGESLIYFNVVADLTLPDWQARWDVDDATLLERVTTNLIDETHNIAERVKVKYGRSDEAVVVFMLGLLFLATSAICFVAAVSNPRPATAPGAAANVVVGLTVYDRLALALAVGAHAFLQLYAVVRSNQQEADLSRWGQLRRVQVVRWVALTLFLFPFALLLPVPSGATDGGRTATGWVGLGFAVGLVAVAGCCLAYAAQTKPRPEDGAEPTDPEDERWKTTRKQKRRSYTGAFCWLAATVVVAVSVLVTCPAIPTSGPGARLLATLMVPLGIAGYSIRLPSSRLRVRIGDRLAWYKSHSVYVPRAKASAAPPTMPFWRREKAQTTLTAASAVGDGQKPVGP